jgi:predicted dehydrogenase
VAAGPLTGRAGTAGTDVIDVAVVGAGYLGSLHAEKYAAHPRARLRALVDPDAARRAVADRLGVPLLGDLRQLPAEVRAVSVAVPTALHHAVAAPLLRSGRDVLVEKPIAASIAEAADLIALAEAGGRVLQVGHLERFNPAVRRLRGVLANPRFIESHRLAPFAGRGTDVDVVRDLMIHDLDIILTLVGRDPVEIRASGVAVISPTPDIANARIEFEGGCVANVTASRVSVQKLRKIRVFQPDAYVSIDYLARSAAVVRRVDGPGRDLDSSGGSSPAIDELLRGSGDAGDGLPSGSRDADGGRAGERADRAALRPRRMALPVPGLEGLIVREEIVFADEEGDTLALEIDAFLAAVAERSDPVVSGREARRALAVAEAIVSQIGASTERGRLDAASTASGAAERRAP